VNGQLNAPSALPPGERAPGTHWIEGWVGPRAGLEDVEKRKFLTLAVLELQPLGCPARSQSLYRLRYPGSTRKVFSSQLDFQLHRTALTKSVASIPKFISSTPKLISWQAGVSKLNGLKHQSQIQGYFTTGGLPPVSSSWRQASWGSRPAIFLLLNPCGHSPCVTSSLSRWWVCRLQLLLALANAVILGPESLGTDRTENTAFVLFRVFTSTKTCLLSCSIATAVRVTPRIVTIPLLLLAGIT
jgi:hypothetical protein